MRILYCNKYNYPFSGTEAYLFQVMALMRSRGHEAALFSMADPRGQQTPYDHHFVPHIDFKQAKNPWQKLRNASHAIYSRDARRRIRTMIEEFRPDVAHVRNIYHHLSPSILWELKAHKIPVLYHINDFKLLCPAYNLVSKGKSCEACKGGNFFRLLNSSCYPGLGARTALMTEAYFHDWLGTYRKCVDHFLAPSRFVRDKFVEHGWDAEKFDVLPHFQEIPAAIGPAAPDAPVLYFGRLSEEKGVHDLLRAMQRVPHLRLVVAGDGPQRNELQELVLSLSLNNVEFAGHVRGKELDALIAQSRFTVLPSHAYETLGKTILESYAQGRPVIASDMGSRRELVRDGETGLLFPTGDVDRLADAMAVLGSNSELAETMGRNGRLMVLQQHTSESHYRSLLSLYEWMIQAKMKRQKNASSDSKYGGEDCGALGAASDNPPQTKDEILTPQEAPESAVRVAFIGGRGVIAKYSGIETYYEEVGSRLARLGVDVTVYCRNYFTPPGKLHNGMRVVRLPTIRSKHLETLVHTLLSTLHALSQPYDIVHYHALGPALFSFLPRLFGKKTLVTVQGLDWQRKKWGRIASWVLQLGERASARLPNGTMVVSQVLQQHYREHHGAETLYVPNGGLLRERRNPRKLPDWGLESKNYILFLGRFSPEKGCHLLIEAYERLNTDVKLVLAGASSYCDEYSNKLRAHASEKIKILDWVAGETLDELLTNAMIFVLPSDMEGLSLALLDAMGASLCLLTSDVPENREAVEGAGFTFRRGDSQDLAVQLQFLIANPAFRNAAGRVAKARVGERYSWQKIALDIQRAYRKMLAPPGDLKTHGPKRIATEQEMITLASQNKAG
jgi:glycosyltransferase involved in cell wall biosynthesis